MRRALTPGSRAIHGAQSVWSRIRRTTRVASSSLAPCAESVRRVSVERVPGRPEAGLRGRLHHRVARTPRSGGRSDEPASRCEPCSGRGILTNSGTISGSAGGSTNRPGSTKAGRGGSVTLTSSICPVCRAGGVTNPGTIRGGDGGTSPERPASAPLRAPTTGAGTNHSGRPWSWNGWIRRYRLESPTEQATLPTRQATRGGAEGRRLQPKTHRISNQAYESVSTALNSESENLPTHRFA